ncbi:hypothetical protein EIN_485650 [Entamoeba invadens IP1]|uniref:Uncharacterized protein n=1 Tax=Entamoeba invadens IP1 TaxID=370355 RepID=A0A0A1UAF4_ENTIV|nr:hypothetical protein EIN_485650 [Entamoeba invadens IP1]ELP89173.1 hypothetical protein EIN_485650 [Entamoeba invadens IP1]|eukprot:XP_004255944.1 hypothetical protein EIN_485650 [Entamoeba invadens IP1]
MKNRVIGIDLGNYNVVVSILKDGVIDIVETPLGQSSFRSSIAVIKNEIKAGVDASVSQVWRLPECCYFGIERLLEQNIFEVEIDSYKYNKEVLLIYFFKMIQTVSQADLCILTLPLNIPEEKKSSIKNILELSGMRCLQIVSPSVCVSLYLWSYFPQIGEYILVLDVGESQSSCYAIKKESLGVSIIVEDSIPIGGANYTEVIYKKVEEILKERGYDFKDSFSTSKSLDSTSDSSFDSKKTDTDESKTCLSEKLRRKISEDVEKFKATFSSRQSLESTMKISISSTEEINEVITRQEFIEWVKEYDEHILKLAQRVVATLQRREGVEIYDIEFIGGGSRVDTLRRVFEEHQFIVKHRLNKENVISKGSVLVGMQLSSNFEKVRLCSVQRVIEPNTFKISGIGNTEAKTKNCTVTIPNVHSENCELEYQGKIVGKILNCKFSEEFSDLRINIKNWVYCYSKENHIYSNGVLQSDTNEKVIYRVGKLNEVSDGSSLLSTQKVGPGYFLDQDVTHQNALKQLNDLYMQTEKGQKSVQECNTLKAQFETFIINNKNIRSEDENAELILKRKEARKVVNNVEHLKDIIGEYITQF